MFTASERKAEQLKRNRTIGEIADIYFEVKGTKLKGYAVDNYRYKKHVAPVFADIRVPDLTTFDMEAFKQGISGMANATICNTLELIRRIINFGVKTNLCPKLSFTIEMPRRDNERIEYMNPEETERFLHVLKVHPNQEASRMLELAYFTAMRRGEIFKLEDKDFDFHFNLIRIRNPKGKRTVSIPMNPVAKEIIQTQLQYRDYRYPDSPYLFPGKGGGQRVDCCAVRKIKAAAKLPAEFRIFHGLRHHYAVTLANSGQFTIDMIGELLTHKSTEMTKRYGQYLPQTLQTAGVIAANLLRSKSA